MGKVQQEKTLVNLEEGQIFSRHRKRLQKFDAKMITYKLCALARESLGCGSKPGQNRGMITGIALS
jgi:hypothetical protein